MLKNKKFDDLISKIVQKDNIGRDSLANGGLMNPAQRKKFIEYIQQSTDLLTRVRMETMAATSEELDGLLYGDRLTRGVGINSSATLGNKDIEDQAAYSRGISSYKFLLNAQELSLFYALSENMLKDNIEGESVESAIIKAFANIFAKDMEDLFSNGDVVDRVPSSPISTTISGAHLIGATTITVADGSAFPLKSHPNLIEFPGYLKVVQGGNTEYMTYLSRAGNVFSNVTRAATILDTGQTSTAVAYSGGETVTWVKHHLLGALDSWNYRMTHPGTEPGATVVDGSAINSGVINEKHFFAGYEAMPSKYLDFFGQKALAWICNEKTKIHILQMISERNKGMGALADSILEGKDWNPLSIPFVTCTKFPKDKILLTNPLNLVVGIWQDITFRSTNVGKTAIATNQRYYNIRARVDCQVERKDYCVLITGINTTNWI